MMLFFVGGGTLNLGFSPSLLSLLSLSFPAIAQWKVFLIPKALSRNQNHAGRLADHSALLEPPPFAPVSGFEVDEEDSPDFDSFDSLGFAASDSFLAPLL